MKQYSNFFIQNYKKFNKILSLGEQKGIRRFSPKQHYKSRRKEEAIKTIDLVNKAEDYRIACEIRNYIKTVELKEELDEDMKKWIEWANKKADWFDPIVDASDELLGKREHGVSSKDKNDELNEYATYYGWY